MNRSIHKFFVFGIASIWFINGFFCKLINLTPRHQQIIGRFFGNENAFILTKIIGLAEILMAIWVLLKIKPRLNAVTQILIIAAMNILEFIFVPDLLLWGKLNIVFAFVFILVIYYTEFILSRKTERN